MRYQSPAPFWRPGEPVEPLRELLRRGGVLAIPTESSYGLGADPGNRIGVEAIYRIKGREPRKALPVVVAGPEQLAGLGIDPDLSILKPLSACWPSVPPGIGASWLRLWLLIGYRGLSRL